MFILDDNCIFIDVDETLLIPPSPELFVPTEPNLKLVEKIKEWSKAGKSIVVWTSNPNGTSHCLKAIDKCRINPYIKAVMRKPSIIVDDDHLEYYSIIDPITLEYK